MNNNLNNSYTQNAQKNNAKMYELVLGRSTETDLSRLLRVNNLRVLDYAVVPAVPIKPRVAMNIALAIILGLLGGIALGVAWTQGRTNMERMNQRSISSVPI